MCEHTCLYLSQADVEAVALPMSEVITVLEAAFQEHGNGRTEMPPKIGIHTRPEAFIHAMPAYIPSLGAAGIKWVSGYPENFSKGRPYITGLLILNDKDTGMPVAVMDCTWITAKRTGAATALAARYLARPDATVIGILGCGVQGRSNFEALREIFSFTRVVAYDTSPEMAAQFATWIQHQYEVKVDIAVEPRAAVSGCDIVVTAGPILKIPHATIQPGWLEEGAFASLVDFDAYWDRAALNEIDKFTTDDLPQLKYYQSCGYFQDIPPVHATLGQLVAGQKPGRESRYERTIACNLGLAIGDMATAQSLYQRARIAGVGTLLPL